MKSFNGRVAAITGAASGMGRALALALAREGCHLALADKNGPGLLQASVFSSVSLARRMSFISLLFRLNFFKQKTAYEMHGCDWSSDVCSSDLLWGAATGRGGWIGSSLAT